MPDKLVRVRLSEKEYARLQQLKRILGLRGDAEAIRALVRGFPEGVSPSMMPVFSAPITSPGRRSRKPLAREHDEYLYGKYSKHARRSPRRRRGA